MSIALGASDGNKVCIGVDTLGIYGGGDYKRRKDKKIFTKDDEFLMSYTGSFRIGQSIKYNFEPPERNEDRTDHEYLCTDFMNSLREIILNEFEEEWALLVGYRGSLYTIQSDFQVTIPRDNFDAEGAGHKYALSAYKVLFDNNKLGLEERIENALEYTSYFASVIKPPFNIKTI